MGAVLTHAATRCSAFNWLTADDDGPTRIPEEGAAFLRDKHETMFREKVEKREPVDRGARPEKPQ
jgi:hypothetical protein